MPLTVHTNYLYSESQVYEAPGVAHLALREGSEKCEGLTCCSFIIFEALPSRAAPSLQTKGDLVAKVTSSLTTGSSW